jgi:hypothetical protein
MSRTIRTFRKMVSIGVASLMLSAAAMTTALGAGQPPTAEQLRRETDAARQRLQWAEQQLSIANDIYARQYYGGSNPQYATGGYGGGYAGGYDSQEYSRAERQLQAASEALPSLREDAKRAGQRLDEVEKDIERLKGDVDAAQKAVEVTVAGRERAFKDGQPYQDAVAAVRQAEAAHSAAEVRLVQSLAASDPEFRKLQAQVAALEARMKALREASPPTDAERLAAASKEWVAAKGELVRRVDAVREKDPQAAAARDTLKAAQAALATLKRDFDRSIDADPAVADARAVLAEARPQHQAAVKELNGVKRDARAAKSALNDAVAAASQAAGVLAQSYGGAGGGWGSTGGGFGLGFSSGGYGLNVAWNQVTQAQAARDRAVTALNVAIAREQAATATAGTSGTTGTTGTVGAVAVNAPAPGPTTAPSGGKVVHAVGGTRGGRAPIPPYARAPRFVGGNIVRERSGATASDVAVAAPVNASVDASASASATATVTAAGAVESDRAAAASDGVAIPVSSSSAVAPTTRPRGRTFGRDANLQRRSEWLAQERARRAAQGQQGANSAAATPGVVDRRQGDQPQTVQPQQGRQLQGAQRQSVPQPQQRQQQPVQQRQPIQVPQPSVPVPQPSGAAARQQPQQQQQQSQQRSSSSSR